MKCKLLLLLFIALGIELNAQQGLDKKIPKQATFVFSLNLNTLSKKINFNDLGNYNFLKKPENDDFFEPSSALKELFRLPDKAGISRTGKLFIFSENHDSIHNLSYLIAISDAKAFETRMEDILKTKQNEPKFKKAGKLKVLTYDHKICISLAKDFALISIWTLPYYYNEDYDEYSEERNRVIQIIDSINFSHADSAAVFSDSVLIDSAATHEIIKDEIISEEDIVPPPPPLDDEEDITDSTMAMDMDAEPEPYYDRSYDDDSLMKQFERRWAAKRKMDEDRFWEKHTRKMTLHQKNINELKPAESLASNSEFSKVFTNSDDIIYWFDYQSYSQQLIDIMSDKYGMSYRYDTAVVNEMLKNKPPNQLTELVNGNSMYGLGNFEKGEIKMNFYNIFNDKLKPYFEKIYSKDINPDFFKYIKSDNLMGLISMSINTQAGADLYYEFLRRASESTAIPNKWAVAFIEITDLFLDKNVLHHTFKGDAVVAFTGIKSYLKTYSDYQYDSLTFENTTVEKTKTDYIPEFVAILTIENLENVKRILKMIKRLDGLTEISKDVYSFKSRSSEINGNFFVVIKDNLLFITNDKPLATEQINEGLTTSRTVGNAYESYLKNSSFGFWDASKMFKLMAEGPEEKFGKPDALQKLSEKINKGFFVTKPLEGNTMNAEITLEMKNRENSSLLELLKLFDDLYIMKKF